MSTSTAPFERGIVQQIEINRSRRPTQRFEALCELLDFVRAMAPSDADARERRRRAMAARELERERWREQCRRLAAAHRDREAASNAQRQRE
jgi:hypothetical protein